MQRIGRKSIINNQLQRQSIRGLTDRSFRLANLLDLGAGQEFKTQIATGTYHPFMQTAQPNVEPDLTKQIVIDIRDKESDYKSGHIPHAVFLPRDRFDSYEFIDTKGGITFDEIYNTFRDIGVDNDTSEIILYDQAGEVFISTHFKYKYK